MQSKVNLLAVYKKKEEEAEYNMYKSMYIAMLLLVEMKLLLRG